jgi:hypothetical protein
MRRLRIVLVIALPLWMAIGAFLASAPPAAAHAHVTVGEYELIVGWRQEPAIVGVLNGLDLGIERHFPNGTTAWVVGVENNLTATLSTGPASVQKSLAPQDNRPGWYTFDVIPTVPGAYVVRLNGTLSSTRSNVPVNLDPVDPASAYQFPVSDPTASELRDAITRLQNQNAQLATLLIVAIAVAIIGTAVGGASLVFAIRTARSERRSP